MNRWTKYSSNGALVVLPQVLSVSVVGNGVNDPTIENYDFTVLRVMTHTVIRIFDAGADPAARQSWERCNYYSNFNNNEVAFPRVVKKIQVEMVVFSSILIPTRDGGQEDQMFALRLHPGSCAEVCQPSSKCVI